MKSRKILDWLLFPFILALSVIVFLLPEKEDEEDEWIKRWTDD